jgi:hypothetical protein
LRGVSSKKNSVDKDISHKRKKRSYEVEIEFYKKWNPLLDDNCVTPKLLAHEILKDEMLLVLEDLDSAGYPLRKDYLEWDESLLVIEWLANFHATFMGFNPDGLWKNGTYWHLDTRLDELKRTNDKNLKIAAHKIDLKLKQLKYKTLLHGDAKTANFCFGRDKKRVAAVDFQYVGGGCGLKDLVYFAGSAMDENECEQRENQILDAYFSFLKKALEKAGTEFDFNEIESEWRPLYQIAWSDFYRFLKGWGPQYCYKNSYSEKLLNKVSSELNSTDM